MAMILPFSYKDRFSEG